MDWISSQEYAESSIDCAMFTNDLLILFYLFNYSITCY